jgi:hypothetical protein
MQADFWAAVTEDGAAECFLYSKHCRGKLDAHHVFPKRRIKAPTSPIPTKELRELACADPRNGVPLCRHHHELVESAQLNLLWSGDTAEFLHDWGLDHLVL